MELSDKPFMVQYFRSYLKQQKNIYSTSKENWSLPLIIMKFLTLINSDGLAVDSKINEAQNLKVNSELQTELLETMEDEAQLDTERTGFTSASYDTTEDPILTDLEKERKMEHLNSIVWIDDIDLLTMDDIVEAEFLQGILCFLQTDAFEFDDTKSHKNPYIHILYQMKSFLHARNFNAVSYLRQLKTQFDSTIYNEEARWEIVRLTILITFLLKDTQEPTLRLDGRSLISQGLDFSDKALIKPSFIKGLLMTLSSVLKHIDHFDDESIIDCTMATQSESFVQADPKIVELRKSTFNNHMMNNIRMVDNEAEYDELSPSPSPIQIKSPFERASDIFDKEQPFGDMEGKWLCWMTTYINIEVNDSMKSDNYEDGEWDRRLSHYEDHVKPRVSITQSFNNTMSIQLKPCEQDEDDDFLTPQNFSKTFQKPRFKKQNKLESELHK